MCCGGSAPLAGQTLAGPDGDVLDNPRHTNLDEIIKREASLPGEQDYENVKNILS